MRIINKFKTFYAQFYYIQDYRVNVSNINFLSSCEFKAGLWFITNINKHQHTNFFFFFKSDFILQDFGPYLKLSSLSPWFTIFSII